MLYTILSENPLSNHGCTMNQMPMHADSWHSSNAYRYNRKVNPNITKYKLNKFEQEIHLETVVQGLIEAMLLELGLLTLSFVRGQGDGAGVFVS